jgi:hypothetical protein
MKVRFGALEVEVDAVDQLDELVMRYGGPSISLKVRIGALEIEPGTVEQLKEILVRYGGSTVVAAESRGQPGARQARP